MSGVSPENYLGIQEVMVRYSTAIDTKDWNLFRSCFTEDCEAVYSAGYAEMRYSGIDEFAAVTVPPSF